MRKVLLLSGILAMIMLAGCSDDSGSGPEIETPDPLPETPQILVQGFLESLTGESIEGLGLILHEDFQFPVLQSTREDWEGSDHPLGFVFFDRAAMLAVHANFFKAPQQNLWVKSGSGSFPSE